MWKLAGMTLALGVAGTAEAQRFDWSELGVAFCRAALAEDVAALGPVITPSLRQLIEAAGRRGGFPPRLLLQSYDATASGCSVQTRNSAIVEVNRAVAGGPSWIDYLVVVPEADGTTRIDDILFSTRRSDTLRERLRLILEGG